MYESYGEERLSEFKSLGHLLGAKFKDEKDTISKTSDPNLDETFVFQDPKIYEEMAEVDQKDLTDKMMGRHKSWALHSPSLGE